jgi:hypothetical protein
VSSPVPRPECEMKNDFPLPTDVKIMVPSRMALSSHDVAAFSHNNQIHVNDPSMPSARVEESIKPGPFADSANSCVQAGLVNSWNEWDRLEEIIVGTASLAVIPPREPAFEVCRLAYRLHIRPFLICPQIFP